MGDISWRDICWRGQQAFYKELALYVFSLSGERRRLPSSSGFFGQALGKNYSVFNVFEIRAE